MLSLRHLGEDHRREHEPAADELRTGHGLVEQQPAKEGGKNRFQAHEQRCGGRGHPLLADDLQGLSNAHQSLNAVELQSIQPPAMQVNQEN